MTSHISEKRQKRPFWQEVEEKQNNFRCDSDNNGDCY